ncbi:sulfatase family protein [Niabella hirudinis]|uniref:sulfatase family protein n=1 Tax=Niabella hirudinis TaxID=1285929 RepID=UPI003EBEA9FA
MRLKRIPGVVVVLLACLLNAAAQQKPNVILIYVDDLGYGDLGCYGARQIQTPHVDALAQKGMRFTNAHSTSATCTPSRYALMTGEYPWRDRGHNILPGDAPLIVPVDKITLPGVFKRAGYKTGIVGKWHLGLGETTQKNWNEVVRPGPNETGFDYSFIFPATADRVPTVFMENGKVVGLPGDDTIEVNYRTKIGDEPTGKEHPELLKLQASAGHNATIVNGIGRIGFMKGGKQARWTDEELAPTFLTKAQQFIDDHKNGPFFLYYAINDIHVPRMPATMFKGRSTMGYRGDAILEMDWVVGEITKQLRQSGIEKNTVIIFSSDNGPVLDDGYADEAEQKVGSHRPAGPLRGWKTSIYEGGTRVPFIVYWPGKVKPGTSDALVSQMDLLTSFASYLKVPVKKGEAPDAENHIKALMGTDPRGRTVLVEEGYNDLAIVKEGWKYIPASKKRPEQLFNLSRDLPEKKEVSKQYPQKVKELREALDAASENRR